MLTGGLLCRSSAPPYQMYGYPHMPQPMGMPYGYGMPPQDGNFPMQGVPPSGVMMSARPQEVSEQVGGHGENGFAQAEDAPEATPPVSRRRKAPDDEDDAETAAEEDLMPAEPLLLGIRLREPCEMITYGSVALCLRRPPSALPTTTFWFSRDVPLDTSL